MHADVGSSLAVQIARIIIYEVRSRDENYFMFRLLSRALGKSCTTAVVVFLVCGLAMSDIRFAKSVGYLSTPFARLFAPPGPPGFSLTRIELGSQSLSAESPSMLVSPSNRQALTIRIYHHPLGIGRVFTRCRGQIYSEGQASDVIDVNSSEGHVAIKAAGFWERAVLDEDGQYFHYEQINYTAVSVIRVIAGVVVILLVFLSIINCNASTRGVTGRSAGVNRSG
jgi:hypothetical protein